MRHLLFFLLLWLAYPCFAQQASIMNQGSSQETNYYTELRYENVRDKIIVEARIGQRNCRFIVDTGAPTTITASLHQELGLAIMDRIPIQDANGGIDSLMVSKIPAIALGGVSFVDIPTLVAHDSFLFDCLEVDGFIGSNLLRQSIVRLLPKTSQLILTDQLQRLSLDKKQAIPMQLNKAQSSPYISVRAKGKKSASITLLFDLGMEGLFDLALTHYTMLEQEKIFTDIAQTLGSGSLGLHGRGKDTLQYRLTLPQLLINKATLSNVPVQTTAADNSRIGAGLLAYGSVTLDYKHQQFYFEPFQPIHVLANEHFPIAVTLQDSKLVIASVWQEGLRDKLQVDDQVLSIDDIDYSNVDPCSFFVNKKVFADKQQALVTVKKADGSIQTVAVRKE